MELPTYTLAEVLESGTCVYVDFSMGALVTWNESATFNVWFQAFDLGEVPAFTNHTCFTNYNATSGTAPGIAKEWLTGE